MGAAVAPTVALAVPPAVAPAVALTLAPAASRIASRRILRLRRAPCVTVAATAAIAAPRRRTIPPGSASGPVGFSSAIHRTGLILARRSLSRRPIWAICSSDSNGKFDQAAAVGPDPDGRNHGNGRGRLHDR
jgi:hypothetical protein